MFAIAHAIVGVSTVTCVYTFVTSRTTERMRRDLDATVAGTTALLDGDELQSLYREGVRDDFGFSNDHRYAHILGMLDEVHTIEPDAWLSTFVRGDAEDTRRIDARAPAPEFISIVDINAIHVRSRASHFLESKSESSFALSSFENGKLVDRPGIREDRYGTWMTAYAPIRNARGDVSGILEIDVDASYVAEIQNEIITRLGLVFLALFVLMAGAISFLTKPASS